jgi:SAM-dependent methyltransferase
MAIATKLPQPAFSRLIPFLRWPLVRHDELARTHVAADPSLMEHLFRSTFSIRMLRYWWAGQAIAEESRRQGRALCVLDVGCERGWLKFFTPPEAVARWVGLDWDVRQECLNNARYDEVIRANFDEPLPIATGYMDVVVNNHVMEHLPRPGSTMAEMSRVLREGGIFLGGSPTMPNLFARLRERWLRRKLRLGRVAPGGHINCLSPERWKSLMDDTGLQPEFATGSHAVRLTGSWLESQSWWIRLNQIWGGLFPSLGSECYVLGRKTSAWASQTQLHRSANAHWRPLWVGLAAAAVLALAWGTWSTWQKWMHQDSRQLVSWIETHQEGRDHFIVSHEALEEALRHRSDVRVAGGLSEAFRLLKELPHAHMLVTEADLSVLCHWDAARDLVIDSRLPRIFQDDLILVRSGIAGTSLRDYWFSDATSAVVEAAKHDS